MLIAVLIAAQLQVPLRSEPVRIVREIQAEVDRNGGRSLERIWRATLSRSPRDPRALLAVSAFERNRYRYPQMDSLLNVLDGIADLGPAWRAMGLVGRALWRSLGSDVPRADTLATMARALARDAGARDVEAEALLVLLQVRARTQGARVGRQYLDEWWAALPTPSPADSAFRSCQRVVLEDQLGLAEDAGDLLTGAEAAERLQSWRIAGNCRLSLAQLQDRRGFGDASRWSANRALAHFRRIDYALGVALASQWYGYLNVAGANYAKGKALLEEAVVAARRTGFDAVEGWAYSGLAELYLNVGDHALARDYATRASESHRRRGDLWGLANARRFEASALEARGDLAEAAETYQVAQREYVRARSPALAIQAVVARINILLRLGQVDSAERAINETEATFQTSAAWRQTEVPVLRGMVALRRGRLDEAASQFLASAPARNWRKDTLQIGSVAVAAREALVALRQRRTALADSALLALTRAHDRWRDSWRVSGFGAAMAQAGYGWGGAIELYPELVDQLVTQDRVGTAWELIERARAREVVTRRLRAVALVDDTTQAARVLRAGSGGSALVTLPELQTTLALDEAFVSYVLGVDDAPGTALVVTRSGARAYRLPPTSALRSDIERFVQLASAGTEGAAGRRLGEALIAPVLADLPPSVTRLIVSPDGALHRLPVDALRLPDGRLVLERVAVSIAPSATALLALRATSATTGDRLIAVGDPRYAALRATTSQRGDVARAGFERIALPRLRYSGEEARRVREYGRTSALLIGANATEGSVRRAMESAAVVHLAAHGLVDDASQFNTALAVTPGSDGDGFLTPAEISLLQLKGPLVVLSSCRSSGGTVLGGEGLRGLTGPLLEAGARAVVGTHWSIGDRSVVPFIDRFYQAMAAGSRPDDALRTAKLAAIRAGVSIADWGSFTVTGDAAIPVPLKRASSAPLPWSRGVAGR